MKTKYLIDKTIWNTKKTQELRLHKPETNTKEQKTIEEIVSLKEVLEA